MRKSKFTESQIVATPTLMTLHRPMPRWSNRALLLREALSIKPHNCPKL